MVYKQKLVLYGTSQYLLQLKGVLLLNFDGYVHSRYLYHFQIQRRFIEQKLHSEFNRKHFIRSLLYRSFNRGAFRWSILLEKQLHEKEPFQQT